MSSYQGEEDSEVIARLSVEKGAKINQLPFGTAFHGEYIHNVDDEVRRFNQLIQK